MFLPKIVRFKQDKQSRIFILLIAILFLVSLPHIVKTYSYISNNYRQYQAVKYQKEQDRLIKERAVKVDSENTRRQALLQRYGITKLEKINSCNSAGECVNQFKIPDEIINYLVGNYLDTRTVTNTMCHKYQNKYMVSKYCGNFFCIDFDQFKPSSDIELTSEQTQTINELKNLGFYSDNDKLLVLGAMDKCERLNFQTSFEEFQKDIPLITNLIRENPKDPILDSLSKSYINFTILNHQY